MKLVAVEDLKSGMAVDLENDQYADAFGHRGFERDPEEGSGETDHMYFECELARVYELSFEYKAGEYDTVVVEFDATTCGFPRGHKVQVDESVPVPASGTPEADKYMAAQGFAPAGDGQYREADPEAAALGYDPASYEAASREVSVEIFPRHTPDEAPF